MAGRGIQKLIFCGLEPGLCHTWDKVLQAIPLPLAVEIRNQDICTLECDCVVSPANSFGFMDGGVDLAYSRSFGWHVQERLQKAIQELPFKELLIGQAMAVATDFSAIPWLIAAPTMRIPGEILDVTAIFLAARAAMAIFLQKELAQIAFPGMGTGTGRVGYEVAAKMMVHGCLAALNPQAFPRSLRELFVAMPRVL